MDSEDKILVSLISTGVAALMAALVVTYYDTEAQRQCREKLAMAPNQYRSASDIAQLCQ